MGKEITILDLKTPLRLRLCSNCKEPIPRALLADTNDGMGHTENFYCAKPACLQALALEQEHKAQLLMEAGKLCGFWVEEGNGLNPRGHYCRKTVVELGVCRTHYPEMKLRLGA